MKKLTLFSNMRPFYAACFVLMLVAVLQACTKKETKDVPIVSISGLSKTAVLIGDTLIISGENFSTTPGENLVSVAGVAFTVIKATPTQLTVIVPNGAQSGLLSIGFNQGRSTTFSQLVTVGGGVQPFIKSISPASAKETDTISIKGGNFAIPYNYNAVTFSGVAGQVINVSDSVIKVIVPVLAQSGPVVITSNGLVSAPTQFSVSKVDPNADGHICWLNVNYATNNTTQTEAIFDRGITNTTNPGTATIFDYKSMLTGPYNVNYYGTYISNASPFFDNITATDKQNNVYYLTNSAITYPNTYNLMMLNTSGNTATPVTLWSLNIPSPVTTTPYKATPTSATVNINYLPVAYIGMDGNTVYIKMGATDDFYIGDVTNTPVTLTLQHNVFGDALASKPQFTKDYIFYEKLGPSAATGTTPNYIVQLRYMPRGSTVSAAVPLPFTLPTNANTERVLCMQADMAHGNNLMIFTSAVDAVTRFSVTNIYKFNADTKQFTTLYTKANWAASGPSASGVTGNTGFFWAGNHIYYSNLLRSPAFNTLYRLNDDGSSKTADIVYGQLEPNGQLQSKKFYFFLGK